MTGRLETRMLIAAVALQAAALSSVPVKVTV
jgi:hypothetical protein